MADKQAQWQEFIDKMESGMSDVSQNVNSTINDSSSTDAQKSSAAQDYAKQQMFLTRIKEMYANGDYDNPTNTFSVNGASSIYLSAKDSKYHACAMQPWSDAGEIASGAELSHDILLSDEFTVTSHMENLSGDLTCTSEEICEELANWLHTGCKFCARPYAYWHCWFSASGNYFNPLAESSDIITGDNMGYIMSLYAKKNLFLNQNPLPPETFSSARFWNGTSIDLETCFAFIIDIDSEEMENPWDYYNDNILPTISDNDNKAIPGGYTPVAPDDPPDEPEDLPHDDGDPPANQTDRTLSVPFNFITQYLLNSEQLMALGVNLWQSWLTPNTDVWMNFFLPYGQDFGTLNIAACMDYIISLRVYPFEFPLDFFVSSPNGLRMGTGHTDFLGTSVAILKSQIYSLDLGTCEVKPETPYDDFRDMYNASVMLYLPYCGTVELNPAEVMYRTLHAYYYIDVQSGGCTAVVTCDGDSGEYNVAAKSGQIGFSIPLTATNAGQLAAQTMKDAVQTVSTIGGFVFDTFSEITKAAGTAVSILGSGNSSMEGLPDNLGSKETTLSSSSRMGKNMFNTATSLANQVLDRLSRSGIGMPMLSGGTGAEAMKFPDCVYLQIRRGKYAKPVNYPHSQGHLNGSSNKISYYAGAFKGSPSVPSEYKGKGLCKFAGVDTTGLTCHDDERAEIVALLESGIYI